MTPAPRSTPSAPAAPIRAVVLDVDGTLYDQRRLRRAMGARLLAAAARAPRATLRDVRVLRAYRHAQEALRGGACEGGAGAAQHRWAADRARVDEAAVRAAVARWMEERPLDLLAGCGFAGLKEFLRRCRGAGLRVGVFSDYPAAAKLRALGVDALVDVARSAHDPEIGRFKPDPAGLLAVAAELGVPPAEVCYVGDRPEVDAEAARRAGMRCVIISPRAARAGAADAVPDYAALTRRVCPAPAAGA